MPADLSKRIITAFLRNWFEFDPSVHVRNAVDAKKLAAAVEKIPIGDREVPVDAKDPGHLTLEAVREAAPAPAPEHKDAVATILASKAAYHAVAALLRDPEVADAALLALENEQAFKHYLFPVPKESPARPAADVIPPQDTFHRWGYFTEVNYEELRTITEAIYPERPDLDMAIALWDVFEGSQAEVDEAFNKHCQRYQDEVPSSIKALEFGHWSLLADFKENRKKIQFYNKHTDILKRILDRHAEDKRIGAELMRNRVRQTKAKNIAEEGPDAPGLNQYRRNQAERGAGVSDKGAERVITVEEMKRLEKAKGNIKAAQELQLLEETEKRLAELTEKRGLLKAAGKDLPLEEAQELEHHTRELPRIREMVNVPDEAIQVDVFSSNPTEGSFEKSHFFTKAVAPEHLARARAENEQAQRELKGGDSGHPAVVSAAQQRAAQPQPQPQGEPALEAAPFAPYAAEHYLKPGQLTEADRKAEALRDAEREKSGK